MKLSKYLDVHLPRLIVLVALLAAGLFFVGSQIWMEWEGEAKIIVLPKSEMVAQNMDQVTGNISYITQTERFYSKMLHVLGEESFSRKDWKRDLNAEQIDGSSVIRIVYTHKDINEVKKVLKKVTDVTREMSGSYYDARKEVQIKTYDVFTARKVLKGPLALTYLSLGVGVVLALIIEFVISRGGAEISTLHLPRKARGLQKTLTKKKWWENYPAAKEAFESKESEYTPSPLIAPSEQEDAHEEMEESVVYKQEEPEEERKEFEKEGFQVEKKISKKETSMYSASRKSSAPVNLPISDEVSASSKKEVLPGSVPGNLPVADQTPSALPVQEEESQKSEDAQKDEPTEEELKERLNKLLRGEM